MAIGWLQGGYRVEGSGIITDNNTSPPKKILRIQRKWHGNWAYELVYGDMV